MIHTYINRPVEVEACQFTGDADNIDEIRKFTNNTVSFVQERTPHGHYFCVLYTPYGDRRAIRGDYIIKDANGDFFICASDVFDKTYQIKES